MPLNIGIVLVIVSAIMRILSVRKDTGGAFLSDEETRGFLKGVSWVTWTLAMLILGAWWGANYA